MCSPFLIESHLFEPVLDVLFGVDFVVGGLLLEAFGKCLETKFVYNAFKTSLVSMRAKLSSRPDNQKLVESVS